MNTSSSTPQYEYNMVESLRPEEHLSAFGALFRGAKLALRYWPVWLMMFLGTLLPAFLIALVPALDLIELAHRPVIQQMADGVTSWMAIDLIGLMAGGAVLPGAKDVANTMSLLMMGSLLMPVLGGLVSAFLYGGVLLTYREAPQPFRLGRFFWGCWHWFGGLLVLALVQALLFLFIFAPLAVGLFYLGTLGAAAQVIALILAVLLLTLWTMLFELARVRMIVTGTRNPFLGIGRAFGQFFRRPLALLGYYGAALLVLLVVQALFRWGINPNVPLGMLLLALLVQQGFVALRLFARAMRMAGLAVMAQVERPVSTAAVQPARVEESAA